jgi:hypothetical protein
MFCENVFSKFGQKIHSYKIGNIAIFDLIDIFSIIFLAYYIYSYNPTSNYICIMVLLFILSIIVHRLLCIQTTIDKFIFG